MARHTIALITGSMNPFTKGHKHLVDSSLLIFDEVIVGIGNNPRKDEADALFSLEQRLRMTRRSLEEHGDRVSVQTFEGASIDYARDVKAAAIVRGLRDESDQSYEASMTHANCLISEIEHGRLIPTIYITCPPSLTEISSSMVRELIELKKSMAVLEQYVLPSVADVIKTEIYEM